MCYSCYSAAAPSASTRSSNLGPASCRALEIPCCQGGLHLWLQPQLWLLQTAAAASRHRRCLHSCSSVLQVAACNSLLPCVSAANTHLRWQQLVLLTT